MERVRKNRNSGLTLIEVMISMLVIMIVVIGAVSYMYACIWNAKRADVRITATRVGQLLVETWKLTGHYYLDELGNQAWAWSVTDFDPTDADFNFSLPYTFGPPSVSFNDEPIGIELGKYETSIDGKTYFVTLAYKDDDPYMLTARVAWSRATGAQNLQWVDVTSYAIY
jgi:type II secretory pathway pseudopilin PulG